MNEQIEQNSILYDILNANWAWLSSNSYSLKIV